MIPPGLCVANTSPGAILPAAPGLFLKHHMAPLPFGHGPPRSVLNLSHSPQPTKTTKAGSKPLCQDSTRLGSTKRRKVSFVEAFSWYKVAKFGHRKVRNATTHQARNSSQKCLNAFMTWLFVRQVRCAVHRCNWRWKWATISWGASSKQILLPQALHILLLPTL